MKISWYKRHAIREQTKSVFIYILLISVTISVLLNYLGIIDKVKLPELFAESEETVQIKEVEVVVEKEVRKEVYWYQFHATGYSANDPTQGTNETMASGKKVYKGAIAADPSILPLGTKVEIKGLPDGNDGIYTVEDTGGMIKGFDIDVFYDNKFDAMQINCTVWVRILEE